MEDKMLFIAIFSGIFCGIGLIFLMVSWIITAVIADRKKKLYVKGGRHGYGPCQKYKLS